MGKEKPKIFLSYAHEDIGMAKKIYNDLMRFGLDVWIDCESLLPGQQWKITIEKAIKRSQYYLLLLSSHSVTKRGFIQKEMRLAYEVLEQCSEDDIYIIPVRLNECEPSLKISEINWIDVFPKNKYTEGLKKILKVVNPEGLLLRRESATLSEGDATEMIRRYGFYDRNKNPEGLGLTQEYFVRKIRGDRIVIDKATGLMWQQGGSVDYIQKYESVDYIQKYEKAEGWINELNREGYAGFHDWRLPTLEEAMSLMEPEQKNNLYIHPVFDTTQRWIWTSDLAKGESEAAWVVFFDIGGCFFSGFGSHNYVRAVRSGQLSKD